MNRKTASISLLIPFAALPLQAQVVVNDSFSDGLASASVATEASWHYSSTSSGLEVATNALGLVSGTSGRGIHGAFGSTSIGQGQSIKLTYTFMTPATVLGTGDKTNSFRIALLDSGTTDMDMSYSASSGTPEPLLDVPLGYYMEYDVATAGESDISFRESLSGRSTGRLLGTSSGWDSLDSGGSDYTFSANTEYTGSFMITRTLADGIELSGSLSQGGSILSSYSTTATGGIFDFDTVAFQVNSNVFGSTSSTGFGDNGIDFSNVTIAVVVPEPSVASLLAGLMVIGALAMRRR
jgi:hypothetical protein